MLAFVALESRAAHEIHSDKEERDSTPEMRQLLLCRLSWAPKGPEVRRDGSNGSEGDGDAQKQRQGRQQLQLRDCQLK